MKKIVILLTIAPALILLSCDKKNDAFKFPDQPPVVKKPVANAGPDISIGQATCNSLKWTILDGSQSYDPENNQITFHWSKISGPADGILSNNGDDSAIYVDIGRGLYEFEVKVTNTKGAVAKDTVVVDTRNWTLPEYNLDINFIGTYTYYDNIADCVDSPCTYTDCITINTSGTSGPFGDCTFGVSQGYDSANTNSIIGYSVFGLDGSVLSAPGKPFVQGSIPVHFKQLIQNGGGPFTAALKINEGSADRCTPGIYSNLNPLTMTGNLDTVTHTVNLNIKGKAYF